MRHRRKAEKKLKRSANRKNKGLPKRNIPVSIMVIIAAALACFIILFAATTPAKYDFKPGDIAPQTIKASKDIEDTVKTEELKQTAYDSVSNVFKQDSLLTQSIIDKGLKIFNDAETLRNYAEKHYLNEMMLQEVQVDDFRPQSVKWSSYLTGEVIERMQQLTETDFTRDDILKIASLTKTELSESGSKILTLIKQELSKGVHDESIEQQKYDLNTAINTDSSYKEIIKAFGIKAVGNIEVNMSVDQEATKIAKEAAASSVSPIIFKEGQNIISAGEVIEQNQYEVLNKLGYISSGENADKYLSVLIYVGIAFVIFASFLYIVAKESFLDTKLLILNVSVIVISAALCAIMSRINLPMLAAFFGIMLICATVNPKSALCSLIPISMILSQLAVGESVFVSVSSIEYLMAALFGGTVIILCLRKPGHRAAYLYAGLLAAAAHILVIVLMQITTFSEADLFQKFAWAAAGAVGAALLAIGTMPIIEAVFSISSPTKLLEVLSPDHPLLKKLSNDANGTYHHSMMTATLAEAAAKSIGANALLTRVAAYYHDIGKIKNPNMFKENQPGENPHDLLEPEKSAEIIREHVSYGVALLKKYKLPHDIIEIASQHHGNTLIAYFYAKAKEKGEVNEADFRYPATRPRTKEAACLMMADSVEAAVRAHGETDKKAAAEIVAKIIKGKMEDGQLDMCDITRREITLAKEAFINVYNGMYHERIKYPEAKKSGS